MPATPADVARAWFDEVWNRGDERAIDRMMADDATFHGLAPPVPRGSSLSSASSGPRFPTFTSRSTSSSAKAKRSPCIAP